MRVFFFLVTRGHKNIANLIFLFGKNQFIFHSCCEICENSSGGVRKETFCRQCTFSPLEGAKSHEAGLERIYLMQACRCQPPRPPPSQNLILTRNYTAALQKPFTPIDDSILQDRDWPKDCYVLEGGDQGPTIVYLPLFNRRNCKGRLHRPRRVAL